MDDFIQEGQNLFPYLEMGAKVCFFFALFVQCKNLLRDRLCQQEIIQNRTFFLCGDGSTPAAGDIIQKTDDLFSPLIDLCQLFPLSVVGRRCRFIQTADFPEFPDRMPLGRTNPVEKDVVFQTVYLIRRKLGQHMGFQEPEKELLPPAASFSVCLCREKTEEAVQEHNQRMVVHGMLLIDESGDLIQRKGSFEKIRIIVGIAEQNQDIPVAEALIPDERCNGPGNFIDLAAPFGGFQDMETGIRSYRGTFAPAERERPAAEEMLRHLLQTERTEADRLLQYH